MADLSVRPLPSCFFPLLLSNSHPNSVPTVRLFISSLSKRPNNVDGLDSTLAHEMWGGGGQGQEMPHACIHSAYYGSLLRTYSVDYALLLIKLNLAGSWFPGISQSGHSVKAPSPGPPSTLRILSSIPSSHHNQTIGIRQSLGFFVHMLRESMNVTHMKR